MLTNNRHYQEKNCEIAPDVQKLNQFLKTLTYETGEKIFIRLINPLTGKSIKLTRKYPLTKLPQKNGFNTYFVVNGQGNKDADIKHGRTFWIEHDDLPKEQQIDLWLSLGLPEPTVQVDTGGKSIHSYWTLSEPISAHYWKELEQDLIEFTKADKSIKNISRVLRLPNCDYYDKKTGEVTGKVTIVSFSGKQYIYTDLRNLVPSRKETATKINKSLRYDGDTDTKEILRALEYIDSSTDYKSWFKVIVAIHNHFNGSVEGLNIAVNWSQNPRNNKRLNYSYVERTYNRISANNYSQISVGSIFYLAKENGFKFEKFTQKLENDYQVKKSKRSLTREQYLAMLAEDEKQILEQCYSDLGKEISYQQWLEATHNKDKNKFTEQISSLILKLFGKHKPKKSEENTSSNIIKYKTDEEKLEIIKNNDTVLDQTITGGGKSYFVGAKSTELLISNGVKKVWYIDDQHTNPTNDLIKENYVNLLPRHNGMIYDEYGRLIHNQGYPNSDVAPNCKFTKLFTKLNSEGHNLNIPTLDNNGAEFPNPICANCPSRYTCRNGYGSNDDPNFLAMRKQAIQAKFTRCHYDSLSDEQDFSQDLIILEEADKQIDNFTKDIVAGNKELRILFSHIPSHFEIENYHLANFLMDFIQDFFLKVIDNKQRLNRYGLDFAQIEDLLSEYAFKYFIKSHSKFSLNEIFTLLLKLPENQANLILSELLEISLRWFKASLLKAVNLLDLTAITLRNNFKENLEKIRDIPSNFLAHFANVLCFGNGYIRFVKGKVSNGDIIRSQFICTIRDERKINILRQAKKVILLTATPKSLETIAKLRGVDPSEITVIEKDCPPPENHKIRIITDNKGIASNQFSDQAIERIKALILEAVNLSQLPIEKIITHGKRDLLDRLSLPLPNTHFWGGVDRGSNLFADKNLQIIVGKPQQNIGSAKATYYSLFGSEDGFEDYYRELIENDILQTCGRSRAILRLNEKIETILIVKDIDPQFLVNRGYSVEVQDLLTTEFSDNALNKKQARLRLIKHELFYILVNSPTCPDLKTIAQKLGSTVKQLSKDLQELGSSIQILKNLWKSLHIRNSENSQKPIGSYIENCEFFPEWLKDRLDNYFSYLESQERSPYWEFSLKDIHLELDCLLFTGWFLVVDPQIILSLLADTRT